MQCAWRRHKQAGHGVATREQPDNDARAAQANTGTLHPQTPVAGAAQARGAGGGGGGSGANRGLVHSGSATVNSLGHLGRTAFCPQLGWCARARAAA